MVIDATKMSDQLNPGNINAASCWLQFVYFTVVRTDVSAGKPNDTQYLTASFNSLTGLSVSSTVNPKQPQWYVDNGGAGVQRATTRSVVRTGPGPTNWRSRTLPLCRLRLTYRPWSELPMVMNGAPR